MGSGDTEVIGEGGRHILQERLLGRGGLVERLKEDPVVGKTLDVFAQNQIEVLLAGGRVAMEMNNQVEIGSGSDVDLIVGCNNTDLKMVAESLKNAFVDMNNIRVVYWPENWKNLTRGGICIVEEVEGVGQIEIVNVVGVNFFNKLIDRVHRVLGVQTVGNGIGKFLKYWPMDGWSSAGVLFKAGQSDEVVGGGPFDISFYRKMNSDSVVSVENYKRLAESDKQLANKIMRIMILWLARVPKFAEKHITT